MFGCVDPAEEELASNLFETDFNFVDGTVFDLIRKD